jgi:hypothetical protein
MYFFRDRFELIGETPTTSKTQTRNQSAPRNVFPALSPVKLVVRLRLGVSVSFKPGNF